MQHALEADVIIVGAGAAGCVIAARLAEAHPKLDILVLEAGQHIQNDSAITVPAGFMDLSVPGSRRATRYACEPSDDMVGRQLSIDVGNCVGGGTAINYMMYTRPSASDFDDWEKKFENPGWGFKSMLPMFKKFETYEADPHSPRHGSSGPIRINHRGPPSKHAEEWLKTALAFDYRSVVSDPNDFSTSNSYGLWPKYIDSKGVRQDAGHAFLYPAVERPGSKVTLRVECKVTRVLLEGGRAVGVEFMDAADSVVHTAKARKLVVLSAGPLSTPQILERSGVGSPKHLADAGITCKVPLEGVGENYKDHNVILTLYLRERNDERAAYLRGDPGVLEAATEKYKEGQGVLGTNGFDVAIKLRPNADELKTLGAPFINEAWPFYEQSPDKPVFCHGTGPGPSAHWIPGTPEDADLFVTFAYSGYPLSRGSIHVRSANPSDPPRFVSGFFSHPADLGPLKWQYKLGREIARRLPSYRGELPFLHPAFPPGSQAACSVEARPVAIDAPDIVYTPEDDAALEAWIRQTVGSMWHSMGTCAMKPHAKGGVVDPRLNVYGVEGLKVADLSICPGNVSANTASTAFAIGEKAAALIAEDLKA